MKKILIVGAGVNQMPLIKLAKSKGYSALVASIDGDYPGISEADKFYDIDVRDTEGLIKVGRLEKIDAVITQLDFAITTVAKVASELGLPSNGENVAEKFSNKYLMRESLQGTIVNSPKFKTLNSIHDWSVAVKDLRFPVVIKPVDFSGSRGVVKLVGDENISEIEKILKKTFSYSDTNKIIIEEYIEGVEFVVQAYTSNEKTKILSIGKRAYFDVDKYFIPKSTVFSPKIAGAFESNLNEIHKLIVNEFSLKYGITHGEYIVDKFGKIYLVEIAARGGGMFIASDLIPMATGININELLLKSSLGEEVNLDSIKIMKNSAGYFTFLLSKGEVESISGHKEVQSMTNVKKVLLNKIKVGNRTPLIIDKSSRFGPLLISGKSVDDIYQTLSIIKENLIVNIKTPLGSINGIIW